MKEGRIKLEAASQINFSGIYPSIMQNDEAIGWNTNIVQIAGDSNPLFFPVEYIKIEIRAAVPSIHERINQDHVNRIG